MKVLKAIRVKKTHKSQAAKIHNNLRWPNVQSVKGKVASGLVNIVKNVVSEGGFCIQFNIQAWFPLNFILERHKNPFHVLKRIWAKCCKIHHLIIVRCAQYSIAMIKK